MRPEDTWKIGLDFAYRHGDRLIREDDVDRRNEIGVKNLWTRVTLGAEYGVTDRLTLLTQLPYSVNVREEGVLDNYYEAHGFGDWVLGARYWTALPDPASWNLFVEGSVRAPTGADDQTWKGRPKAAYIQPGLGQWGLIPRVGFQKGFGDLALSGSVARVFNLGVNSVDYESADATTASVAFDWVPLRFGKEKKASLGFSLAFSGIWIPEKDKRDGTPVGNTGGEWYYAIPGVHFTPDGGDVSFYVSVPYTLHADVHSLQTGEAYAVNFGLEVRF